MSGISGLIYLDGRPAGHATLKRMLESISHRGPNGHGVWCGGPVGLGQCMYWITPESLRERQPLLSPQADLVLVADARIDNRNDLIKALSLVDHPADEITDGQLILESYLAWGESCPGKLEGDFSFVIWDSREQSLFCARDTAGVKPFYYHLSPGLFAFASEIKAILTLPDVPRRLNEHKLADFLVWSFEDTRDTFYKDIHRLLPSSTLTIKGGSERLRQYWVLDPEMEIHLAKDEDYIQAFQELFNKAVHSRVRGVSSLGSTLSGGLDSSSIACTARNMLVQKNNLPLKVFSVIFPTMSGVVGSEVDERWFIDQVISKDGFEAHFIDGSRLNPLIDPQQLYTTLDEPYFAPTLFLFWNLYKSAKKAGIRVLLDGTDGDRTISHGQDYLADLARAGRWIRLWQEASALAKVQTDSEQVRPVIWRYGLRPNIPSGLVGLKRRLHRDKGSVNAGQAVIKAEFDRRIGYTSRINDGKSSGNEQLKSARYKHWHTLTSGTNALSLELIDKASAVHNIEVRFPFYDRRLIEFCLALPPDQKLNQGRTRYIMRAAMQDVLPPEVQWRTSKANLPAAFSRQLYEAERRELDKTLTKSKKVLEEYIDLDVVDRAFIRFCSNPSERINDAYLIYGSIILADWIKYAGFC